MKIPFLLTILAASLLQPCFAVPSAKAQPGRREAIELLAQGDEYVKAGKTAEAADSYQRAIQLAPSPVAYYKLGSLYAKSGQKDQARQYLNEALKLNPNYELARVDLSELGGGRKAATGGAGGPGAQGGSPAQGIQSVANSGGADPAPAPSGGSSMNIDAVQRENETMRSLAKPDALAGLSPEVSATPKPVGYAGIVKGLIPKAPSNPGAGAAPRIPKPGSGPVPEGAAREAVIPPAAGTVVNHSRPLQVEYHGDVALEGGVAKSGDFSAHTVDVNAAAGSMPTPAPKSGGRINPMPASPAGAPEPVATSGGATETAGGGKKATSQGASANAKPTVDQINAAAFGAASKDQVPSTGYGNQTEIALGTYAFHRDRADQYRLAGRYADAAREYETALRLNPKDTEGRAMLAEVLAKSENKPGSDAQFAKAQREAPDDPVVQYRRGNLLREQKKPEEAIRAYLRAISMDPDHKFAHNNLGVVYMEQGEYDKAATEFKRVLELDPKYDKAMLNLGIIYDDHMGDKQEALKYYELYVKANGERSGEVKGWINAIQGAGAKQ